MKQNKLLVIKLLLVIIATFSLLQTKAQDNPLRDSLRIASNNLEQHADSIDLRLKRATWYLLLQDWNSAKNDYDLILHREPDNVSALFYRAYANERLGRYNFARLDYNNLIKLVPGHFEGQLGLALLNEKDKHYTEAMDGINSLIEQYPESAIAYAARAGIEQERGMLLLAEYDFTQAIQRDPNNIDYILQRMEVYAAEEKTEHISRDIKVLQVMKAPFGKIKPYIDLVSRKKK